MHYQFDFSEKKVLVVGGAGDIGFAIAETFHAHGAEVTIIDKDSIGWKKVEELNAKGLANAYMIEADLMVRDSVRESFGRAIEQMGQVDVLVSCAGIIRRADAEDYPEKDWDQTLEVNLTVPFLFGKLAAKNMMEHGGGRIINIGSMNSFDGGRRVCGYASSKGGVALLTKSFSNEWSGKGINVNAIAPGYIATQLNTFYRTPEGEEQNRIITSRIPKGRWGCAEDLAGAALFLASDAAEYISGVVLPVDGGYQAF